MQTKTTAAKNKTFATSIDLAPKMREPIISVLNPQLADTFDLYSPTKQAHWVVKGAQFHPLHELFDELAAQLLAYVDVIAERAMQLGGVAMGTARMAANCSRLPEFPTDVFDSMEVVKALTARGDEYIAARLAATSRAAIDTCGDDLNDMDTADLFTDVSRGLDKSLWFLEAHLQR